MAEYSLGTAHGTVKIDSDTAGIDQADQKLDSLGKKAETSGMSLKDVGTKMGIAGLAIAGGIGLAVNSAASFEQQLSGIRAVSGATAGDMDLIRDAALRIGADTAFSASEAAGAMTELAKAGVPVKDILGGAADAVVALAAATGIDLETASGIASNAMNIFNIDAKDMDGVVNTLAQTANASSIDVTDLGMAFSQVGAVAKLAGLSLGDTANAVGQLGDAGIKGSDAGTSLKTLLSNLQPTTKQASAAMRDLGLITEDGSNKFYDAQGNLKSMHDIQGILGDSTKNLTSQQKQMALETIFGSDAIRAAAVLAENGAAGFDAFAKKQTETGTAADQAKIRQDNFKGSLEQLGGSVETLGITMGTMLLPAVRGIVEWITNAVNWFTNLSGGTQKVILIVAGLAAGLLLLGAGMIKVVGFVKGVHDAMVTLRLISTATQASFIKTAAVAVWNWAKIAATAAVNAAKSAASWLITNGAAMASSLASMAVAVASTVGGWLLMAGTAVVNAIIIAAQWLIAFWPVVLIIAIIAAVIIAIVVFWDQIVAAFKAGAQWVGDAMSTAWDWIKQAWDWILQKFQAAWDFIVSIFTTIFNFYIGIWASIIGVFVAAGQAIWDALKQAWQWIQDVWNSVIGFFKQIPGWIAGVFSGAFNWLVSFGQDILNGLWNGIKNIWSSVTGWLGEIGGKIIGIFTSAGSWLLNAGGDLIRGLWNGISNVTSWILGKIKGFVGNIIGGIKNFFGIGSPSKVMRDDVGRWLVIGLGNGIENNAGHAVDAATTVAAQVVGAMQDGLAVGANLQASIGGALTDGTLAALGGKGFNLGTTADTAVSGLNPVTGTGAMNRNPLAIDGTVAGKQVYIEMKTYNPVAEKASDSEARKLRAAAAVGAF